MSIIVCRHDRRERLDSMSVCVYERSLRDGGFIRVACDAGRAEKHGVSTGQQGLQLCTILIQKSV